MSRLSTIILCLILSAILGFFLLWPQYQKFSDGRWKVKEKKIERDNQEEYFSHMESLSNDLKDYGEQISKIISAFPSEPDVPALLNFIANASAQNGMNLEKITSFFISTSADQAKKTSAVSSETGTASILRAKEIVIDFNVNGEYASLKNFISTLEKSVRIIEIESISLKKNTTQSKEGSPSFDMKIKSYYH